VAPNSITYAERKNYYFEHSTPAKRNNN